MDCYYVMLPRLQAQEALQATLVFRVGCGLLNSEQLTAILGDWRMAAKGMFPIPKEEPKQQQKKMSLEDFERYMAAIGMRRGG